MGSYGIGPGRVLAALVEQRHDERGIVWPRSVAPYDVHVLSLAGRLAARSRSSRLGLARGAVRRRHTTCCSTIATQRPGEKFADADLLGCPLRRHGGQKSLEDGAVDVRRRADDGDARVASRVCD